MARHATGAQIERLAAGRRRVDCLEAERSDGADPGFAVRWFHDESGAVVINARLAPEGGSVVIKALEEAIRKERATPAEAAPGGPRGGNHARKCSAERSGVDHDGGGSNAAARVPHDPSAPGADPGDGPGTAGGAGACDGAADAQAASPTPDPTGNSSQKCSAEHSGAGRQCALGVDCPNRDKAALAADALVSVADSYLAHPDRLRTGVDLGYAVGCLIDSERGPGHRDNQIAGGGHTFASRVAETTHDSSFLPHQQNHMQY